MTPVNSRIRLGKILLPLFISACSTPDEQLTLLFPFHADNGFQYVDPTGKTVIPPQFSDAGMFIDGLAPVSIGDQKKRWGFITETGTFAVPASYLTVTGFSDGLAWVVAENGPPTAIDKNGQPVFTIKEAESARIFSEGLAAFSTLQDENVMWGYTNRKGQITIPPGFFDALEFSDGLAAVRNKEGKWGYADDSGQLVIPFQFDEAGPFSGGIAVARFDNRSGIIGRDGKYLINPQFTSAKIDGDRILVRLDGKYGWCDRTGAFIITPQFKEALPFQGNDLAAVRTGDSWGFVGTDGLYRINPQFSAALSFVNGIAIVRSERKSGIIDVTGKYVVNPQFNGTSRDLVAHITVGRCEFTSVRTDFFNIKPVVDLLTPEELLDLTDFRMLAGRYTLTESAFRSSYGTHVIRNRQQVSGDAAVTLSAVGVPFRKVPVRKTFGGFTYTDDEQVFDPSAPLTGFDYDIRLTRNGSGKAKTLADSIATQFSEGWRVLKRKDGLVVMGKNGAPGMMEIRTVHPSRVTIRITPASEESNPD